MNKNDLIESVAAQLGISKASATQAVNAILSVILRGLSSDGQVAIPGFGTFASKQKPARVCHNPRTGEKMTKEAHRIPAFKAGKEMKESIH